jgi:hypothetical protein
MRSSSRKWRRSTKSIRAAKDGDQRERKKEKAPRWRAGQKTGELVMQNPGSQPEKEAFMHA